MNVRSRLFGYDKTKVNEIVAGYENMVETQKKDIEYLQNQNSELRQRLSKPKKQRIEADKESQNNNELNEPQM